MKKQTNKRNKTKQKNRQKALSTHVIMLEKNVLIISFFLLQANDLHVDIIYRPMIYYCTTNNSFVWLLLVYGFKGILLIFGLFLAWETRKVKIAALNDSHHIGRSPSNHETVHYRPHSSFRFNVHWLYGKPSSPSI